MRNVLGALGYVGLGLAATCAIASAAATSSNIHPGVYALLQWDEAPDEALWRRPDVDGVVIRTYWMELNPGPSLYNWELLDRTFAAAAANHKYIHLEVVPGFYSPSWVLKQAGVETASFTVPQGPYAGQTRPLPLPWNETYLGLWFSFLDTLAKRYAQQPAFGHISAAGPNSHNGEIALPREGTDEAIWLGLVQGKSQSDRVSALRTKLLGAWQKTIDQFAAKFQGKRFTVALIQKSLPIEGGPAVEQAYKSSIVAYGVSHYPQTFGVQTNGLDARPLYPRERGAMPHWALIEENVGRVLTGFQTRAPANLYPGARRTDPRTKHDILNQTVLVNGVGRKVDFIEIYAGDIRDSGMADIVRLAHARLTSQ